MADIERIRQAFRDRTYVFSAHGSDRAAKRAIRAAEIEQAITSAEVIEDYPDDKYGPSCLMFGRTNHNRPLHIQVGYSTIIKIITVYEPSPDEWEDDLKTRKPHEGM